MRFALSSFFRAYIRPALLTDSPWAVRQSTILEVFLYFPFNFFAANGKKIKWNT